MAPKKGSQCKKADNPCKICLQSVNPKTGLQCSGACRTWVHYECANYTPGKISDIKEGIIRVTCPCPDCETRLPREYRVTVPTCANLFCPANNFSPHCENDTCPTDGSPVHDNMNQTGGGWPSVECGVECKKHTKDPDDPHPKPWPVAKCGAECKKHTNDSDNQPRQNRRQERKDVRGDCYEAEGTPSFSVVGQMCSTIGLLAKQMNTLMTKVQNINDKLPESNSQQNSPGGCHDPAPCQKESAKDAKCCCSARK